MATNGTSSEGKVCPFEREKIMAELNESGYSVIPGVLTVAECDAHIAFYRDWLAKFGEDDWPFQRHSLIQSYRIGHFKPTWETRLAAKKVFETVWQTQKLLSSIDAVAISAPPEEGSKAFDTPDTNWLHLDQSARRQGLHAYQGAVYLEEASDTDYCFRVLEGSHQHTSTFYNENPLAAENGNRGDFFKLRDDHVAWYQQHGCRLIKVSAPKGSIVLWDSRLVHDNCRPEQFRPHADRWRFVVFVCMTPARWATAKDLAQKRQAYKRLLMTTHWPSQGVTFFHERQSDSWSGVPLLSKLPDVARSEVAKRLAGVLEYDFEDEQPNGPDWDPVWQD